MYITCIKAIEFDAGHRIMEHENKCRFLHGHRYRAEFYFASINNSLDSLGRVIDFGKIRDILKTWIDENFDHNLILCQKDKDFGNDVSKHTGQKVFYLPHNPTAENIAKFLLDNTCKVLFLNENVRCVKVRLYETPNSFVEVENGP